MRRSTSRFAPLFALAVASTMALTATGAVQAAADYPNKPVKWIVPYPPGGTTDVLARIVAQLAAQVAHVHVDHVRARLEVVPPHV